MSEVGNQNNNTNLDRRTQQQRTSSADLSPARDAWGRPIKQDNNDGGRQQQNNNNNGGGGNNDGIDDADIDTIWDAVKKKTVEDDDTGGNKGGGNQQQQVDPQKQLTDYLDSVGLAPISLSDTEKEEMKEGNFDNVFAKINDKIKNAHLKAMSGSKTMIDAAVADAVTKAMQGANSTYEGKMNLNALHTALPFTKDKAIGPVAQSVMQKFLDRGLSTEDAIDGTRRWFDKTRDMVSQTGVNKNRNGNFGGSRDNSGDDAPDGGWLKIMRGE